MPTPPTPLFGRSHTYWRHFVRGVECQQQYKCYFHLEFAVINMTHTKHVRALIIIIISGWDTDFWAETVRSVRARSTKFSKTVVFPAVVVAVRRPSVDWYACLHDLRLWLSIIIEKLHRLQSLCFFPSLHPIVFLQFCENRFRPLWRMNAFEDFWTNPRVYEIEIHIPSHLQIYCSSKSQTCINSFKTQLRNLQRPCKE